MRTALFPKDITDAMRTCILSIFWPKKDIISFFQNNSCTKVDLKEAYNYKDNELTRSQIVDLVFSKLYKRNDGGIGQFRSMLKSLIEWNHFDPYYFKTLNKLDEKQAMKKSLVSGLVAGTAIMAIGMGVLNYFLILPAYSWFMGWETMSAQVKWVTVIAGILPFNALKGIVIAALFVPLFMKMKPWIAQKRINIT